MFSWLAASYVPEGLNVALLNYRLCPAVRIDGVVEDVVGAVNWLATDGRRHGFEMDRVVVAGHSAGGHLVGALFAAFAFVVWGCLGIGWSYRREGLSTPAPPRTQLEDRLVRGATPRMQLWFLAGLVLVAILLAAVVVR